MEKWIRFYADRHGVDPDTAVKVWRAEGGMEYPSSSKDWQAAEVQRQRR